MSNELVNIEKIKPIEMFTLEGVDPILKSITNEARKFTPDLSTLSSRKEIASMANKVARSKTLLDGLGKDLVSEWKDKARVVDMSRRKIRDYLDKLKVETRKPLTDWENKERERISTLEFKIEAMRLLAYGEYPLDILKENFKRLNQTLIDDSFDEFFELAMRVRRDSKDILNKKIEEIEEKEAKDRELEKLRKEARAREVRDHEAKIAAEAAAKAKHEAENRARIAAEKQEQARMRAIVEKEQAIKREEIAKEKAADDLKLAELKRINDVNEAKKQEQAIIKAKIEQEKAENAKREANKKHRAKIKSEAAACLIKKVKLTQVQVIEVITAIELGKINNIRIIF